MILKTIKHTSNIRQPAWSPIMNKLVFRDYYENLYVVDVDNDIPQKLVNDGSSPQWSPDGKFVYYLSFMSGNEIGRVNVDTLQSEFIYNSKDIHQFALSTSGANIVISHKDKLILADNDGSNIKYLIDVTSGYSIPNYENLSWSSDDNWIVCVTNHENTSSLIAINSRTMSKKIIYEEGYIPSCSPTNNIIAFIPGKSSANPNSICLWDFKTEKLKIIELEKSLLKNKSVDGGFSWSPNGKLLAFVQRESGNFLNKNKKWEYTLCLLSVADEKVTPIMKFDDGVNQESYSRPTWSPDSKQIAITLGFPPYGEADFYMSIITL